MSKFRLIIMSDKNKDQEEVIFTTDFETQSSYFCNPGATVNFEKVINADLPDCFPVGYYLKRV